jgi:hypothetical protein
VGGGDKSFEFLHVLISPLGVGLHYTKKSEAAHLSMRRFKDSK